jgi:hypothetical protein
MVDHGFRIAYQIPGDKQQWLVSWAIIQTTSFMDLYMSVTVEMDLLGNDEKDYFYWYWDYIYSSRCWAINHIRENRYQLDYSLYEEKIRDAQKVLDHIQLMKRSKKYSKTKDRAKELADATAAGLVLASEPPAPLPTLPDEALTRAKGQICRAIFRLYVIAGKLGVFDVLKRIYPYGLSPSGRFDQRFQCFQDIINPPVLSLDSYFNTIDSQEHTEVKLDDLLQSALICFQNAKKLLEEVKRALPAANTSQQGGLSIHDKVSLNALPQVLKANKKLSYFVMKYSF